MKKEYILTVVLVGLVIAMPAYAVPIGNYPGLQELINRADAIVILRIDQHLTDFQSPTLYSTHECYIYQTIKGNIPKNTRINLQLMDTETSFATPYAHGSTHLMFLMRKATEDEATKYRTITFKGAQTLLSPLGHEKMPEGKTVEQKIRILIKGAIAYQAKEHESKQKFLKAMLNNQGIAKSISKSDVPVEGKKVKMADIKGLPDDMAGMNKVFNDWFQACRGENFELAKTMLHPDAVDKAPQCIDATVKLLEMAKNKPLVIIAVIQNANMVTLAAQTKGGLLFQGQPILISANLNKHEGKWRIAFITANRAEMLKEFISHTKEKSPDAKIWLANSDLNATTVKREKIPAAPPVKALVDDIIQRKDMALRRKALKEIEKMLSHESTVEDKRIGLATLRKSFTARFDRNIFRPLVIAQLKSKDSHTRSLALGCLPSLNAVTADLELITPMAQDSSAFVRQHVGSALISIGDGDHGDIVIPALIRLLEDSDPKVIDSTLRSMWGQYNSPEFDKLLIELSNSKQHHGRTIYHCLSTMKSKSPAVCRRLVKELDNPDWNHSGRAAWGLTYGVTEKAKPIVESGLLQALPEEMNGYTRSQEFKALGRVATEKSRSYLQSVIDSDTETEKFQEMARKILARLAENKSNIQDN